MPKAKKNKKKGEEVCEIFEVEKNGNEKEVVSCGVDTEYKPISKKELKNQEVQLKYIFLIIGMIFLALVFWYFIVESARHFEYRGVEFDVVKEGDILFHRTNFYVEYKGQIVDYYLYMRKDPRKLKGIPVNGDVRFIGDMIVNNTEKFQCDGDGSIAIVNFANFFNANKVNILRNKNVSCSSDNEYMFVQIQPGEETSIEKIGPYCYTLNVADCEILDVTERFIFEGLVRYHENLN